MTYHYKTKVFFDLETTGLDTKSCDIIQLSAVCGACVFNGYTVPSGVLTDGAREVTGFTICDGQLFRHGVRINTISPYRLLTSFIDFLLSFPRPILLVAHNAKLFDAPVLVSALKRWSLKCQFDTVVTGFLDTFILSKNVYVGLVSYSQIKLIQHFLDETYDAHNALEDAKMLQKLFNRWHPSEQLIQRFIYGIKFFGV